MPSLDIKISIIVATRNRKSYVLDLLHKLASLQQDPHWELVIIDNGSNDRTFEALQSYPASYPITVLQEPTPGKGRALNLGISRAVGELLVFTDDDITPSAGWLKSLYEAADTHTDINIFGGKVEVPSDTVPEWVLESYNLQTLLLSLHDQGDGIHTYECGQYPIGPNMAIRKHCLRDDAAPYPVNLGPGTKIPVGDERVFLSRYSGASDKDRLYVGGCIVSHIPEVDQLDFKGLSKRCFHGGLTNSIHGNKAGKQCQRKDGITKLIYLRTRSCKSFHELYCIVIRAIGAMYGRYFLSSSDY